MQSPTSSVSSAVIPPCMQDVELERSMQKQRAEYITQALAEICQHHAALKKRKQRVVVCLVARWIDPLVREQWARLELGQAEDDMSVELVMQQQPKRERKKKLAKEGKGSKRLQSIR